MHRRASHAVLLRLGAALAILVQPLPALADALHDRVAAILAEAGPGTRWGLVVADESGREVLAIDPEGRFMPASNTKIVTTAAAYWTTGGTLELPDGGGGASVRLVPGAKRKAPDVVLAGFGDARMSSAPDCVRDCLATLADAIAAGSRRVGRVIGDDRAFPDQRWSPGMSWNNIPTRSGTGISALSVDDNEIRAVVTPGPEGAPPLVALPAYYEVRNLARTVAGSEERIGYDRMPGSPTLIVTGTIGTGAAPETLRLGVDDPAHYAAWLLTGMLRARGVTVEHMPEAMHRPLLPEDDPEQRGEAAPPGPAPQAALAKLDPPPLREDVVTINKLSQNLHAELLLRRLARIRGGGSIADGQALVRGMFAAAGVPEAGISLSDGSGMSSYNRVTPRAMVRLLDWIARQTWGDEWRASLPVGGTDGTLGRRFAGTSLFGEITAKTGSLNATNALAGYFTAKSGRTYTFAAYANDVPDDVAATAFMDRALVAFAEGN
ncbi:D-alanyl-D-alanine carboxypeptidase/D-alanyl-D-alanine-endopeptidase [Novosphingobium sp. PC22D]|uniref:D-alanyl-D-alanine carboxypeptidase/D-alanyl-D-alanine endopeptidase n=1 Tax=Novosphingobium sp. PC22D TaxID=1962403 RepID=UPI000BF1F18A|nr:D-alanyl-D-alanine carboxypeptidase/D-alanyl-D-alanine-endopeptidase [Novosphingobium sp. PC22D]PEQ14333.1 D-alanyl-D-alanine carboxypeptidase/D-alanyl-D-alanine-endopeptidase [Novosphingobium sp. PC22D]